MDLQEMLDETIADKTDKTGDKWPKSLLISILGRFLMMNDTFLTKELIAPLDANKPGNLTRQIKQNLS
jgi:hypothetical protein